MSLAEPKLTFGLSGVAVWLVLPVKDNISGLLWVIHLSSLSAAQIIFRQGSGLSGSGGQHRARAAAVSLLAELNIRDNHTETECWTRSRISVTPLALSCNPAPSNRNQSDWAR